MTPGGRARAVGALVLLAVLAGCGDDGGGGDGGGGDGAGGSMAAFCDRVAGLDDVGSVFDSADGEAIGDLFAQLGEAADEAPDELAEQIGVLRDVSGRLADALEESDDDRRRAAAVQEALSDVDPAEVSAALQALQQAMQDDCDISPGP